MFLSLFQAGYHGEIIGNNTTKVLSLFFVLILVLVLVPGRSQMIALRGSYSDGCRKETLLHIIFITPMTVNDVHLSFVFRRINVLNP
jgi:hypothetical protein